MAVAVTGAIPGAAFVPPSPEKLGEFLFEEILDVPPDVLAGHLLHVLPDDG